jgi:uncharacterized protein (DUF58 family)
MIVPRTRLIFWAGMVFVPCGLLLASYPGQATVFLSVLATFVLIAVVDCLLGRKKLAPIAVQLPALVRMSRHRRATLEVRVQNTRQKACAVRLALVLPGEIESDPEEMNVNLPSGHEWSRFAWSCTPRGKGVFRVDSACLEISSPCGLWAARKRVAISCELRVYPNLHAERKNLAALFLNRGAVGLHVQRQVGKGREFEKLREYLPGDGFEDVHWKATAKRGKPVTKVFQLERTQEVYVVIDASRLAGRTTGASQNEPPGLETPYANPTMARSRGTESTTALDRYISAALVLGLIAEQQGDLFGLLTFSDKVDRFVRAKTGKAHFSACREALCTLAPNAVTSDYEELFTFIRLRLRRRALLIFLTALDDPMLSEAFVRNLELVRRQHLVLVNMIQPPGVGPIFGGAEPNSVDELYQHLGGHLLWENLCEVEKVLQRRGVRFLLLNEEQLSLQLVHQYLNAKRRQAL